MKNLLLLTLLFSLLGLSSLTAQVTTANLRGTVTGQDGEVLTGATVVAKHEPSGVAYGTTTRDDGRYNLPNLRIGGPYTVEVSYVGYEKQVVKNINLTLGQNLALNFKMQDANTTIDGVDIVADRTAIFSKERTGSETSISNEKLTKLPTISRSASDFTRLTPASDGNSFGGRNDQFNNFSLDGSIFNNPFGLDAATPGGQTDAQPVSLDAIEQITVSLAPYDVTQAGFTGAAVNAVTKSGTNQLKGTVFGFWRNQALTGGRVNGEDIFVPDLDQIQAGFSLGGPIIKNKLFFFANLEIDNRSDLGSNFIANTATNSGKNVSRVEAADLQAVSDALMNAYGYDAGLYEGFIHNTNSTKGIAKLDWVINSSNTLTATYNFLDAFKDKPAHPSALGRRGPDLTTLQFQNAGYQIQNGIHSGILELRSLFGNKASNKFQVGYSSFSDERDPFSDPFPVININKDGIRYIVAGHEPFSIHNRLSQNVFQLTNNLNLYAGNHTITVGTSLERFDFDNSFNLGVYGSPANPGGSFGAGFESVDAFLDSVNSGSFQAAVDAARNTFAANGGDDGVEGEGWALAETNVGQWAVYVQDQWDINENLNITAGIRMDMPLYFNTPEKIRENLSRQCCYDSTIVYTDENGDDITFDHTVLPRQVPLISPRIGFNWDLMGNQKAQLRGGSGLFSGRLPFVWIGNQVANPNFFFYNVTHPDFRFPQVWRSNLGLDLDLGSGWILTTDVIYTNDINASMVRNYGLKTPTGTLQGVDNRPIYNPDTDRTLLFGAPTNAYVFTNTRVGSSFNASLQIQKTFKNGLYLMAAYNYLNAVDASSIEAEISSDAYDRNPAFGNINQAIAAPSLYGMRHRIIGSAYKTFKYGPWATTLSTFFQIGQGGTTQNDNVGDFRFSYTYSGDINGDGSGLNDLIYIPTEAELGQMNFVNDEQRNAFGAYIEQDAYLSANRGQYAEKYAVLAPWYSTWDFRVLQDFNFDAGGRPQTIQFSLDVLNFGNFLNSNWNVKEIPVNTQPLGVTVTDGVPTYSFDPDLTSTFAPDFSLGSRWQARFGLRYIF